MSVPTSWHAGVLLLGGIFWLPLSVARAQERPNIILVLADDLGVGDLGVYGQDRIPTPNLDALARRGRVFSQAYAAAPVCAPSRCSLLTGLYAEHCAVTENARPNVPLSHEEVNLGLLLGAVGYRTAMVGKWGLGGELRDGSPFSTFSRPDRVGFDVFFGILDQERAELAFPESIWAGTELRTFPENEGEGAATWGAPVLLEGALAFLDSVDPEVPFFLFFAPTLPHREYRVPRVRPSYEGLGWPEAEQAYATMVSELDDQVGQLVARIAARGLSERTFVVFASDNGPNGMEGHEVSFFDSAAGLRGQKRDLYEGGLRVPLIVAGPGITPSATPLETPVALYDLLPTFAELAGTGAFGAVDGRSLVPLLRGALSEVDEPVTHREALVFSSDEARGGEEAKAAYALRAGALSLIELRSGGAELFDLSADPAQAHDLAAERPGEVSRLRALRADLSAPRAPAPPPRVVLGGTELLGDALAPSRDSELTPVLSFDFGVEDPAERSGDPLGSRVARPALRLLPVGGAGLDSGALRLPRDPSGVARAHGVLGAEPSFGFGRSSFTLSARVRLDEEGRARAVVACARPAGRELRFTDWAVLARVGEIPTEDLATLSESERAERARRVGVLFGDPTLSNRGLAAVERQPTLPVVSSLTIEDGAWHSLEVTYDAERAEVRFRLDERSEVVPVAAHPHYPSDGPLVLGGCLGPTGQVEDALVGALDDVRLARGARPSDAAATANELDPIGETREATLTFDAREEGPFHATLTIENPLDDAGRGRAVRVEIDRRRLTDRRITLVAPERDVLLPGASLSLELTLDDEVGALTDQSFTLVATDALLGTLAAGTPVRVTLVGEVLPQPSRVGWIEAGVLLLLALVGAIVWLRRAR